MVELIDGQHAQWFELETVNEPAWRIQISIWFPLELALVFICSTHFPQTHFVVVFPAHFSLPPPAVRP